MTTIAYRNGVMAADRQVTMGDTSVGDAVKVVRIKGVLAGFSGNMALGQKFLDWVSRGMAGEPPGMKMGDSTAQGIVAACGRILTWDHEGWDRLTADYYAIGSGRLIALGAMAVGASAEDAVRAAIRHDVYSSGAVLALAA